MKRVRVDTLEVLPRADGKLDIMGLEVTSGKPVWLATVSDENIGQLLTEACLGWEFIDVEERE